MPQFVTISPTHVSGKKEYAWNKFREGGYIAIGWGDNDFSGKTIDQVIEIIKKEKFDNENVALEVYRKFLSLKIGDYVAVNNTNSGLFGIGVITSPYQYKLNIHDSGCKEESYSSFLRVEWKMTNYVKRSDIIDKDETGWPPYGTMSPIYEEVPLYIRRLLGEKPKPSLVIAKFETPEFLHQLIDRINNFRKDTNHQERGHESLVEDFFVSLGYKKDENIKYRVGRIDLSIWEGESPLIVVEVKRDWNMSLNNAYDAIRQAYNYALDKGCRLVVVTNGDDYLLFDRIKGLSIDTNIIGQFRLSSLVDDDLQVINRLRSDNLKHINIQEVLRNISECFGK